MPPRQPLPRRPRALPSAAGALLPATCALVLGAGALVLGACASKAPAPGYGQPGTIASFDLDADLGGGGGTEAFFALPFPSDLRLAPDGRADWKAFPNPKGVDLVESFRGAAQDRRGFSVMPVAWFHFSAPIEPMRNLPVAASLEQPVLLLDVDPASPERGRLVPLLVDTPVADDYLPANTLALAPRPGFVLAPARQYAFVVRRGLGDLAGKKLGVPAELDLLRQGKVPPGARGPAALPLFAPLWDTLKTLGLDGADVAAATVFTTGDAVAEVAALSDTLLAKYSPSIDGLALDVAASTANDRVCKLTATVQQPQFQAGKPLFNTDGLFVLDAQGVPVLQRTEATPLVITLPRSPMPAAGYPLMLYFHGSGGASADVIDRGPSLVLDHPLPGLGPGWVHAKNGVAAAGSALPVNPERVKGAPETAYLNLQNPVAMRDTFRQGVIEQRLLLRALLALKIDPALVAACGGTLPSLPAGAAAFQFDAAHVIAQGQSMGGMYTNLFSAVEPLVKIAVPTGAGGYWSYFLTVTELYGPPPSLPDLVAGLIKSGKPLTHLHPVLAMMQSAWEPNDPFVAMPRLAHRPLPGHPVRPIYQPVGKGDQYFPTMLYDAVAVAYGHQQAQPQVWASMQDTLRLAGLDGFAAYSASQNRTSLAGGKYTSVVVQFEGDGIEDPHAIYRQLDAVKHQYSCFVKSWLDTGVAVVPAPGALEAACN